MVESCSFGVRPIQCKYILTLLLAACKFWCANAQQCPWVIAKSTLWIGIVLADEFVLILRTQPISISSARYYYTPGPLFELCFLFFDCTMHWMSPRTKPGSRFDLLTHREETKLLLLRSLSLIDRQGSVSSGRCSGQVLSGRFCWLNNCSARVMTRRRGE